MTGEDEYLKKSIEGVGMRFLAGKFGESLQLLDFAKYIQSNGVKPTPVEDLLFSMYFDPNLLITGIQHNNDMKGILGAFTSSDRMPK